MKKTIALLLSALLLLPVLCGCGTGTAAEKKELSVVRLNEVPHSVFYAPQYVALELGFFEEEGLAIELTNGGGADKVMTAVVSGQSDIGLAGPESCVYIYNQGKEDYPVVFGQLTACDGAFLMGREDAPFDWEDLRGKTIYASGKGNTPEYALNYVLTQNGIDPASDVTIEWKSEQAECLSALMAEENTIAMLPQPFVTSAMSQVEGLRVALDMNEEWQKVAGSKLVTGVLVVRKDAVENDPEAFAAFMDGYAASVEAANSDLEGTAALCEQYGVVAKAALAQKALPQCNIVFETGDEMKTDLETYFKVLYAADPASVGGALPADDFYYAG